MQCRTLRVCRAARYTPAMMRRWHNIVAKTQRVFRLVVLFLVVRMIVGIAMIVFFDRNAVAWGPELTVVVLGALAVVLLVGLAVRHVDAHPHTDR
jgi:hypothetical protein